MESLDMKTEIKNKLTLLLNKLENGSLPFNYEFDEIPIKIPKILSVNEYSKYKPIKLKII